MKYTDIIKIVVDKSFVSCKSFCLYFSNGRDYNRCIGYSQNLEVQPWIRSSESLRDHGYENLNNNLFQYFAEHQTVNISCRS